MDLNKAMVEMYKRKSAAVKKMNPSTRPKIPMASNNDQGALSDEDSDLKKRAKLEKTFSEVIVQPKVRFQDLFGCDTGRELILKIVDRFKRGGEPSKIPHLIYGSHGLGKTSFAEAAANYADLDLVVIPLIALVDLTRNEFKTKMEGYLRLCKSFQKPLVVLFDDLDEVNDRDELRIIVRNIIRHMLTDNKNLLVFCTTCSSSDITKDYSKSNLILEIQLRRPDQDARLAILKSICLSNGCFKDLSTVNLKAIASNTPSFTPLDLRNMLDIAQTLSSGCPSLKDCDIAIDMIKRSFKRGTYLIGEKPKVTWDEIGGLPEIRKDFVSILRKMNRKANNQPDKFAGIALYGPPGCGKTMVAQAMANEAGLNFISIKPAELVVKFLGETERNIRRVFGEAREHEPCMIYFDEFDGLCGSRDNKDNITSAIQTLLSEMDGFDSRGKSIILASTNRLEDIDPAMMRPGRLSNHIYVGPPDEKARKDILNVIVKKQSLSLGFDVSLDEWAKRTVNFTGAELDFLMAEAESKAFVELETSGKGGKALQIRRKHLEDAMVTIRSKNVEIAKKIDALNDKIDHCREP